MAAKRYARRSPAAAKKLAHEFNQQLNASIMELVSSDAWPKLLAKMSKKNGTEIGRYSFQNMMLILTALPEASAVATFESWLSRGRCVRKGSKALRVNAPRTFTARDTRGEARKTADGEDKTVTRFSRIPVFDISQTDYLWQEPCKGPMTIAPFLGKTEIVKQLTGEAPEEMREDVTARIEALGYTVEYGPTGSTMGYTDPKTKRVRVSDTVAPAQAAKTLAHELGHILADHVADFTTYKEHQGRAETVAESFAYMVGAYYGLDTVQYSAPYIGTWAGDDPEEVSKVLQETGKEFLTMFRAFVAAVESPELETLDLLPA